MDLVPPITLFTCIVVFHSIFSIQHGPPLFYLHGKKLKKSEEIDTGMKMNSASLNSKNVVNYVGIFNDSVVMNSSFMD